MKMRISTIAAVAKNGVIGKDNDLVWSLPTDMKFFMDTTKGHAVITGRKNYESIPEKYRPLKDRLNIVVTRNRGYSAPGAVVVHSLEEALNHAHGFGEGHCFVIGGGQIYKLALDMGMVDHQFITHVHANPEGDAFYPSGAWEGWTGHELRAHEMDDRHDHAFVIVRYDRPTS